MIGKFIPLSIKKIESTLELTSKPKGERLLGIDPVSGKQIAVRMGRYGPIVVIGDKDSEEKRVSQAL